jgi:hypothetical protein
MEIGLRTKEFKKIKLEIDSFGENDIFIIESGECHIDNPNSPIVNSDEKLIYGALSRGTYFGTSTVFQT